MTSTRKVQCKCHESNTLPSRWPGKLSTRLWQQTCDLKALAWWTWEEAKEHSRLSEQAAWRLCNNSNPRQRTKEGPHGWGCRPGEHWRVRSAEKVRQKHRMVPHISSWGMPDSSDSHFEKNHCGCGMENGMEGYKDQKGTVNCRPTWRQAGVIAMIIHSSLSVLIFKIFYTKWICTYI